MSVGAARGGEREFPGFGIPDPGTHLTAALAVTLELLAARISNDLDADASEGTEPDDPAQAGVNRRLADYGRECAEILDRPEVTAAVEAAWAAAEAGRAGAGPGSRLPRRGGQAGEPVLHRPHGAGRERRRG
jgi:hypothetical protein